VACANNHAVLASNISAVLNVAIRHSPCLVYNPDVRVQVNTSIYRYPDVAVSCDLAAGEEHSIHHPVVLIEVLSETTEEIDRNDKLAEYRALPSMQDYVLVNYGARLAEQYHRAGAFWTFRTYGPGETIVLDTVSVVLAVDDIYAKVRLPGEATNPVVSPADS